MLADNVLGLEIVLKISYLPSKLRFSAKYSFFGQSLGRGHYQPTYQPPEWVYLLNIFAPNGGYCLYIHEPEANNCLSIITQVIIEIPKQRSVKF